MRGNIPYKNHMIQGALLLYCSFGCCVSVFNFVYMNYIVLASGRHS
jgi:hypothetical protein